MNIKTLIILSFGLSLIFGITTNAFAITGSSDSALSLDMPIQKMQTNLIRSSPFTSKSFKRYGIYRSSSLGLVVVKPTKRDHTFINSGTTAKKLLSGSQATYAINGSYFRRGLSGEFFPTGTLGSGGKSIFDSEFCNDVNLCSRYNLDTFAIQSDIKTEELTGNWRSSGPRLVMSGVINDNLNNNRSHRKRKAARTAIISNGSIGGTYFIFSTTGYTLLDFATQIQSLFPASSAINLDGGSSTSFASKKLNRNSNKLLPEFFLLW